jgi:MFS family permease
MVSAPGIVSNTIETAPIRKLRIRLLPFLFALYLVAFIDRINLGFAALTMNRELAITSQQFGFAAGIFFWAYFLLEIPSNLILHRIGARVWIARILITWGGVATLTGFVQSANQLYVARFALGLAEAGYSLGIVLYLGYWFQQREKAQAIAVILMGIPLAGVLGAPISGFTLDHVHWFDLSSWRWLLILEGLPAVMCVPLTSVFFSVVLFSAVAIGAYSFLPVFMSEPAEFLTGFSASAGIAFVTSVSNLGGFVGPYTVGIIRQKTGNSHYGLICAGVFFLVSAGLALVLPKRALPAPHQPSGAADVAFEAGD